MASDVVMVTISIVVTVARVIAATHATSAMVVMFALCLLFQRVFIEAMIKQFRSVLICFALLSSYGAAFVRHLPRVSQVSLVSLHGAVVLFQTMPNIPLVGA